MGVVSSLLSKRVRGKFRTGCGGLVGVLPKAKASSLCCSSCCVGLISSCLVVFVVVEVVAAVNGNEDGIEGCLAISAVLSDPAWSLGP